jgi:hypothetical protein
MNQTTQFHFRRTFRWRLTLLLVIINLVPLSPSSAQTPAAITSGLDYFKGAWTVSIKDGPAGGFRWKLADELDGSWLAGQVERNGQQISHDYWRQNGALLERFAFSASRLFVRLSSPGRVNDQLVFAGVANDRSGEFPVRETIRKISRDRFTALW